MAKLLFRQSMDMHDARRCRLPFTRTAEGVGGDQRNELGVASIAESGTELPELPIVFRLEAAKKVQRRSGRSWHHNRCRLICDAGLRSNHELQ